MRVVLVDFAVVDMFQCGILVPYLQGLLRARGVDCSTVRFGLRARSALDSGARVVLDAGDLEALSTACSGADTVVFSHPPSDQVLLAAGATAGRAAHWFGFLEDAPLRADWLRDAWGVGEDELLAAVPDYACRPANARAAAMRPMPYVLFGDECGYHRGLQGNPWFKGLSFPPDVAERGCTFCAMGERTVRGRFDQQAARHALRSAVETPPWGSFRKRIRIVGSQLLGQLDRLVDRVLEAAGGEDCDIVLGGRVDSILRHEQSLRRALEALGRTGCRIQFNSIGVESFSAPELERFNKGITPARIVELLLLLRRLARRFPRHFDCEEYGGLSLILFTPWTTPEDLRCNYDFVALAGIRALCNKLFSSRLRLRPATPLTWLAKRDGLLTESYDDPLFDKARHSFYPDEIPWRFADPRVGAFNRISMRLEPDPALAGDGLYQRVQHWLAERGFAGPLEAALALVQRIEEAGTEEPGELMRAVAEGYTPRRTCSAPVDDDAFWEAERLRFDRGARRAAKLEVAAGDRLDVLAARAAARFAHVERIASPHGGTDLYYADTRGEIDRLRDASERMYRPDDERQLQASIRRAGTMLGYPSCCVQSYARDRLHHVPHQIFNWLLRRYQQPVEIPPVINPFVRTVFHVPCSCSCRATEAMLRAEPDTAGLDGCAVVFLLPLGPRTDSRVDGIESLINCVFVEPVADDPAGLGYRGVEKRGTDTRLDCVMEGNRLELDQGRLTVYHDQARLHTFCLQAQVWYHRRAFDIAFWRPFIGQLVYRHIDLATGPAGADPDRPIEPPPGRYLDLQRAIESTLGANPRIVAQAGYRFTGTRVGSNRVLIGLHDVREQTGTLELMLQYKQDAEGSYLVGDALAACLPPGACIAEQRVDSLVGDVLASVEAFMHMRAGRG